MNIAEISFFSCSFPTFASLKVYNGVKKMVRDYDTDDREVARRLWLGHLYQGKRFPKVGLEKVSDRVGLGLFAREDIKQEQVVGEYTGLVKKHALFASARRDYVGEYTIPGYPVKYIIDAGEYGSVMRYVNHSEEPNVYAITVIAGGILRVYIVAKRPVALGAQLLIDYGPNYWRWRQAPTKLFAQD